MKKLEINQSIKKRIINVWNMRSLLAIQISNWQFVSRLWLPVQLSFLLCTKILFISAFLSSAFSLGHFSKCFIFCSQWYLIPYFVYSTFPPVNILRLHCKNTYTWGASYSSPCINKKGRERKIIKRYQVKDIEEEHRPKLYT